MQTDDRFYTTPDGANIEDLSGQRVEAFKQSDQALGVAISRFTSRAIAGLKFDEKKANTVKKEFFNEKSTLNDRRFIDENADKDFKHSVFLALSDLRRSALSKDSTPLSLDNLEESVRSNLLILIDGEIDENLYQFFKKNKLLLINGEHLDDGSGLEHKKHSNNTKRWAKNNCLLDITNLLKAIGDKRKEDLVLECGAEGAEELLSVKRSVVGQIIYKDNVDKVQQGKDHRVQIPASRDKFKDAMDSFKIYSPKLHENDKISKVLIKFFLKLKCYKGLDKVLDKLREDQSLGIVIDNEGIIKLNRDTKDQQLTVKDFIFTKESYQPQSGNFFTFEDLNKIKNLVTFSFKAQSIFDNKGVLLEEPVDYILSTFTNLQFNEGRESMPKDGEGALNFDNDGRQPGGDELRDEAIENIRQSYSSYIQTVVQIMKDNGYSKGPCIINPPGAFLRGLRLKQKANVAKAIAEQLAAAIAEMPNSDIQYISEFVVLRGGGANGFFSTNDITTIQNACDNRGIVGHVKVDVDLNSLCRSHHKRTGELVVCPVASDAKSTFGNMAISTEGGGKAAMEEVFARQSGLVASLVAEQSVSAVLEGKKQLDDSCLKILENYAKKGEERLGEIEKSSELINLISKQISELKDDEKEQLESFKAKVTAQEEQHIPEKPYSGIGVLSNLVEISGGDKKGLGYKITQIFDGDDGRFSSIKPELQDIITAVKVGDEYKLIGELFGKSGNESEIFKIFRSGKKVEFKIKKPNGQEHEVICDNDARPSFFCPVPQAKKDEVKFRSLQALSLNPETKSLAAKFIDDISRENKITKEPKTPPVPKTPPTTGTPPAPNTSIEKPKGIPLDGQRNGTIMCV